MKIALVTDSHFGARNDNLVFNEYFFDFWENHFFPYLLKNNIKQVIHLGDILDRRKFGNYNTLFSFRTRFLDFFEKNKIKIDIIIGNHDTYYKRTNTVNSVSEIAQGRYKYINVFPSPKVVKHDKLKILYLPWINSDNNAESTKMIESKPADVIMGHLELNGFEMYAGHTMDKGGDSSIYSDYETVMTGHYHHKSTRGNIHYLGSTYEITWHDFGDDRGFHIFDTNTKELEYVKNPLKMFHKVYYDDSSVSKPDDIFDKYDFEKYRNRYVKVIVESKNNSALFQRFVDRLHEFNPYDLSVIDSFEMGGSNLSSVGQVEDTLTLLSNYIESMVDMNDKEKRQLKNLMNSLHSEALEME